ncbi:CYTH domain-containing protein [Lacticaseibacillus songhuajiangensis]|jgi:uncharacterized protein YjbK|uniref:CYTH domain-containing protein n=1 Tax=Lacticaseibacillus songhuajiangensis TaxID=1296539 RepID=UPI000F78B14D|nr:CYTH domain-containing protein [Lacticaseibacillus songhuajiangensis]
MSISQETELKTMLPAAVAAKILLAYAWEPPFKQTNHYFDTTANDLKHAGSALRIRRFADRAEQTLKVRAATAERSITEYTDPLTLAQADTLLASGTIQTDGMVTDALNRLGVAASALHVFASVTTERRQCVLPAGLLVLDHSMFADGTDDWELEIEYHDHAAAAALLTTIAADFDFVPSTSQNKIARAIAHMPGR